MNFKKTAGVAAAGVLALSLAACGGSDAADTAESGAAEAGSPRANQMYTWVSNESDREQWETFIDGVHESGDTDFKLELEGPTFQEYWTLMKTRVTADDAPCILTTQAARAQELGALLAPLDELAEEAGLDLGMYNEAMMEGMTVDGTVRAIPYDAEPMLLYYNKEAFQEAGLEEPGVTYTWDAYLSDAEALTGDGKYGTSIANDITYPYTTIAFANGNTPVVDGELDLTNPGYVEDVQKVMDLSAVYGVTEVPGTSDTDEVSRQKFFAGDAAMIIDGPWFYSSIVDGADFEVGIAVPPSDSGDSVAIIQGSGFGIAETCPDKKAAFENIVKMTTPEVVGYVGQHRGTVPSIEEALEYWAEGKPADDVAVVEALLENGLPFITTPTWNQVYTQFQQYSPEGASGEKTAEEILQSIQQSVN